MTHSNESKPLWFASILLVHFASGVMADDGAAFFPTIFKQKRAFEYVSILDDLKKEFRGHTTQVINGTELRDDKVYVRLHWSGSSIAREETELFRTDEKGVFWIDEKNGGKEQRHFSFPLKPGDVTRFTMSNMWVIATVVGKEAVFIDGKGYENCWHLHYELDGAKSGWEADEWRVENIGLIKSVARHSNGTTTLTLREQND